MVSNSRRISNHYLIQEKIGKGGMGDVYLALDERLDRQVAIKQLKIESESSEAREQSIQRFKLEAKAIAKLNHPNIVSLYDIATEQNQFYMIMEYVKGSNLQEILLNQAQKLPINLVLQISIQLCEALRRAHENGIVHRDIKPANILVSHEQEVKLTDFGIAQLQQNQDLRTSQAGTLMGSFLYASPEQLVNSAEVDARTDIYAVGATLYELLTGRTVYEADNIGKLIQKVFMDTPVSPKSFNAEVSDAFSEIILRCLEKYPESRYQTTLELLKDLYLLSGQAMPGTPLQLPPTPQYSDSRSSQLRLSLLRSSQSGNLDSAIKFLRIETRWLELFLKNYQCVQTVKNFLEAKNRIKQSDLQGEKFSGILSFKDHFVFVKEGLIIGALNSLEGHVNDDALRLLPDTSALLGSYALNPEIVMNLSSFISSTGIVIQENLDSRVLNLFPILADLESEVEKFNGYVICQVLGKSGEEENKTHPYYFYIYSRGTILHRFCLDENKNLLPAPQSLQTVVENNGCLLSIYMPSQKLLDTVLFDFLKMAHLKPSYQDPQDSTLSALIELKENEISEWMRSSLYETIRNNFKLQLLSEDQTPFPEVLAESLQKRKEYQSAQWIFTDLSICIHHHSQKNAFQHFYPQIANIHRLQFYQPIQPSSLGPAENFTLCAYAPERKAPVFVVMLGKGQPEELKDFIETTQNLNREYLLQNEDGILAALYLSTEGFDNQALALFSKYTEKPGLFNKLKGFVKTKNKSGFHLFLIDSQNDTPRLIAPSFI
ncbi:hypothetical protein COW36_14210 [bacterium (Candidatus Blackallbacteria) CG17_big_fil_post_rev_8_21_14_2_50_48_46]|uniref:non-specific serine/threonine protein kinase n=1 Tax=bacterium (Candidatus Blackallbacteria) CG17_big_fil_post_rev_8_21_14_2_50_48_46 TaxID=2014261 RepID=A0A2M7G3C6_9BACT|nr:MAG: hypothetical protein COW64_23680 [bacterium (Candidatus Blackallbacteria) CG18_big_fil_WC_8_21_14_2_50_49_26]PIW16273.1 MAG: hypothetical protein COW36_14210 [bacterium (Candidatus Blackallbacteria) CG17_big_fil_post_rev_8_21_14_2_50_48_46]PIW49846.1 MAG: hypothetical protein COW20_04095 [bacterium (Candidatus Blackallbacteria) CG13_big_fil_rev_8_21_14_2_50_49_14]